MKKVYILVKGGAEGIEEVVSVHLMEPGAKRAWRNLCDVLIKEYAGLIEYELGRNTSGNRWVWIWMERIDVLKTYDYEYIQDKLYPSETPYILESELKR